MTTFTKEQQAQARKSFIEKSRENAWGAACHADFLSKTMEGLFDEHQKLIDEDARLEKEIKALDNATDHHTVENRTKRKRMQEVRQQLSKQMEIDDRAARRAGNAGASTNRRVQSETGKARRDVGVEGGGEQARRRKIRIMKAFLL
jgi:hypothetical protein